MAVGVVGQLGALSVRVDDSVDAVVRSPDVLRPAFERRSAGGDVQDAVPGRIELDPVYRAARLCHLGGGDLAGARLGVGEGVFRAFGEDLVLDPPVRIVRVGHVRDVPGIRRCQDPVR